MWTVQGRMCIGLSISTCAHSECLWYLQLSVWTVQGRMWGLGLGGWLYGRSCKASFDFISCCIFIVLGFYCISANCLWCYHVMISADKSAFLLAGILIPSTVGMVKSQYSVHNWSYRRQKNSDISRIYWYTFWKGSSCIGPSTNIFIYHLLPYSLWKFMLMMRLNWPFMV